MFLNGNEVTIIRIQVVLTLRGRIPGDNTWRGFTQTMSVALNVLITTVIQNIHSIGF